MEKIEFNIPTQNPESLVHIRSENYPPLLKSVTTLPFDT